MVYSTSQEFSTAETFRPNDVVSRGALNNFRTEAVDGLNNAQMVRSVFGTGETSPGQNYWLDSTLGKVTPAM